MSLQSPGDTDVTSPIGRFIDYRPELSNPGNFWLNEGMWQVSSALALSGSSNYDLDHHQQSRSSLGVLMDHFPGFRSSVELRNIHPDRTTFLDMGVAYDLNAKYSIGGYAVYSFREEDFESFSAVIRRRIPGMLFGFALGYDNLSGETSLGFTLRPEGFGQGETRTHNLTGTDTARARASSGSAEPGQTGPDGGCGAGGGVVFARAFIAWPVRVEGHRRGNKGLLARSRESASRLPKRLSLMSLVAP